MPKSNLSLPEVIQTKTVFHESIITIQKDLLQLEDGKNYTYYSLLTKPASVAILATTVEGLFVLNQEYRHPTGKILLSCPGGYIDEGESPLEAAKRELLEETGFEAKEFKCIGEAYPYPGISGQKIFYFSAHQAKCVAKPKLEISETLFTVLKSELEIRQAVEQGVPLDGPLCSALFFHLIIN